LPRLYGYANLNVRIPARSQTPKRIYPATTLNSVLKPTTWQCKIAQEAENIEEIGFT